MVRQGVSGEASGQRLKAALRASINSARLTLRWHPGLITRTGGPDYSLFLQTEEEYKTLLGDRASLLWRPFACMYSTLA